MRKSGDLLIAFHKKRKKEEKTQKGSAILMIS